MDVDSFRAEIARRGGAEPVETAWAPGTVNERHTHGFSASLLVLEGEMTIAAGDAVRRCRAGDRFSLDAGVPHSERVGAAGVRFLVARGPAAGDPAARARYFDSSDAFDLALPPVPRHRFVEERDRAFDPDAGSAIVDLDRGPAMALDFAATTPLLLAHYLRIAPGDRLPFESRAGVELYYVIAGAGRSAGAGESLSWKEGDAFALPGGAVTEHEAREGGSANAALLWAVTNAPALAFEGLSPPPPERSPVQAVRYPAAGIARRMAAARPRLAGADAPGLAVVFSSQAQERRRNVSPGLTFAMNQLPPRGSQRPHRHNSVAVSLAVNGPHCHSVVDGERMPWRPWETLVTPPGAVHSHHNGGDEWAHWLIVQDGGYHYHCRTMEFRYADGAQARRRRTLPGAYSAA